ncbi:MAG: hypothetical protein LZF61_00645 [Nitrosomonas sp.]|nr:MAG: hypothetical protein LZF61_00645 [Nitrosomonas sp.]
MIRFWRLLCSRISRFWYGPPPLTISASVEQIGSRAYLALHWQSFSDPVYPYFVQLQAHRSLGGDLRRTECIHPFDNELYFAIGEDIPDGCVVHFVCLDQNRRRLRGCLMEPVWIPSLPTVLGPENP